MTNETRTTLLIIGSNFAATVIGPIIGEALKNWRTGQAKPAPEAATLAVPQQRENLSQSPWIFPPLFIVADIAWLANDFRSHAPITRLEIYNIASMAASVWFNILWMSLNLLKRSVRLQQAATLAGFQAVHDGTKKLTEALTSWKENQDARKEAKKDRPRAKRKELNEL